MRILVVHTETEDILINHLNLENDEIQRTINEFYARKVEHAEFEREIAHIKALNREGGMS